jgi:hypothetical protein
MHATTTSATMSQQPNVSVLRMESLSRFYGAHCSAALRVTTLPTD